MLRPNRLLVPAVLAVGLLLTGCSEEVDGAASPALDQADVTVGPGFQRVSDWIDTNCPNA